MTGWTPTSLRLPAWLLAQLHAAAAADLTNRASYIRKEILEKLATDGDKKASQ